MYRELFPQWDTPPHSPRLRRGRVDVWRIPAPGSAATLGAGRPPSDDVRAAARQAMHDILARYLDRPAAGLEILTRPGGKPYLEAAPPGIEFNLSHCADLALLAVTTGVAVGIDVEGPRVIDDPLRLARRVLRAPEIDELTALPAAERGTRFLDLWTRMEARQKAIGCGIFAAAADPVDLTSVIFRPAAEHCASLSLSPRSPLPRFRFFDYRRT